LFFISVIVVYLVYKIFRKSIPKKSFVEKIFKNFKKNDDSEILDNNDFLSDRKAHLKILFII
jgi:hypothetical protein